MEGKVKIGARMVRASIIGNLIGILLFMVFFLGTTSINVLGNTTVIPPYIGGIFGYVVGLSGAIGIELSKDLE